MWRIVILMDFLQCIYMPARLWRYELIAMFGFFPCPHLPHFCFKLAQPLHHRELVGLSHEGAGLCVENCTLKLNDLGLDIREVMDALHRSSDFGCGFEARNCSTDAWNINHGLSPWAVCVSGEKSSNHASATSNTGISHQSVGPCDLRFVSLLSFKIV